MNLRKAFSSLLFKVALAIILGIISSLFFPAWLARVFVTFNSLFGNFLGFFIPVLIFALITPAIAGLGKGAGKWLAITTGVAYGSTVFAGLLGYLASVSLYPTLLAGQTTGKAMDVDKGALAPYFAIEMPAPFGVMTALLLAFTIGVAMTAVRSDTLYAGVRDLERVIMRVISAFIIPLLPVFIYGMFLAMGMNGNLTATLSAFAKVLLVAIVMTIVLLVIQYAIAGAIARQNPVTAFKNMLPAYLTALGTSSSAATIPVTYACTKKNGVASTVAGFTVPLCATTHLAGSMLKISLFAFAIMHMNGMPLSPATAFGFILMLGITMVAAPGVPGGAIMAATGLLASMLGFDESQVAIMIAAYIAIDSFGTACNVTGDGAIALVINKLAKGNISRNELDDQISRGEIADVLGEGSVTPEEQIKL
ncbi:dicarboxylate/amino acid:cation symporter [Dermabacteraceae bacterium TAE3-ERU27]|nr:dicarboxylate/amino acid:cation symporter [Dermabacteraceae bacterium TAE3-ERU27]